MNDKIRGVDLTNVLLYLQYLLGQRYAELLAFHADLHLGPAKSMAPLSAIHYALNQASASWVGQMLKERDGEHGSFTSDFPDELWKKDKIEVLPDHRLWSPEVVDALRQWNIVCELARSAGNRSPNVAEFVRGQLLPEASGITWDVSYQSAVIFVGHALGWSTRKTEHVLASELNLPKPNDIHTPCVSSKKLAELVRRNHGDRNNPEY